MNSEHTLEARLNVSVRNAHEDVQAITARALDWLNGVASFEIRSVAQRARWYRSRQLFNLVDKDI